MKIAFLVSDISVVGGVERVVSILSSYFKDEYNYNVKIISMYKPKNGQISFDINTKIEIEYLNYDEKWVGISKDIQYQYRIFKDSLINQDIDILFTMYTPINVCAAILKKKLKYKVIACQHGQYYFDGKKWNVMKRIFYRRLDILVLLTNRDEEIYKKFTKHTKVMANPCPFKREYRYNNESNTILSIGRLSKEKSLEYLIHAFSNINNEFSNWNLEIVGDGPEKEELMKLSIDLGIEKQVIFKKFTSDIIDTYKKAAFTILTSQSEALPMMLIESKSLGIPSVSFDIRTGPREIINNNEDGYLVTPNNTDELSNTMKLIMKDRVNREELAKKAYVNSEKYDIESICEQWKSIIEDLVD